MLWVWALASILTVLVVLARTIREAWEFESGWIVPGGDSSHPATNQRALACLTPLDGLFPSRPREADCGRARR